MVRLRRLCWLMFCGVMAACGQPAPPGAVATSPPTPTAAAPSATARAAPSPGATAGADATVSHYFEALGKSDCNSAFTLLIDPLRSRVGSADALCHDQGPNDQNATARVVTASGDPSSGQLTVSVTVTKADGTIHNDNVIAVLQDGGWKISDILINPGGGGAAGQINMESLLSNIPQQYAQQAGGATITLTCPRSGSFPATQGDNFQCNFTDTSGRRGTLTINITSTRGDYTWSIP